MDGDTQADETNDVVDVAIIRRPLVGSFVAAAAGLPFAGVEALHLPSLALAVGRLPRRCDGSEPVGVAKVCCLASHDCFSLLVLPRPVALVIPSVVCDELAFVAAAAAAAAAATCLHFLPWCVNGSRSQFFYFEGVRGDNLRTCFCRTARTGLLLSNCEDGPAFVELLLSNCCCFCRTAFVELLLLLSSCFCRTAFVELLLLLRGFI